MILKLHFADRLHCHSLYLLLVLLMLLLMRLLLILLQPFSIVQLVHVLTVCCGVAVYLVHVLAQVGLRAGLYKVSYNLIFFPNPIFNNIEFLPRNFPFSPLDIHPNSLNIKGEMILLHPLLIMFFLKAMIFPFPLHNLISGMYFFFIFGKI